MAGAEQWRAVIGTTTYELGIETDSGTNDGTVDGTNDQMLTVAGITMVYDVVNVSPLEMIYSVVVSMMTETVDEAIDAGKTLEIAGCGRAVGTTDVVTVYSLDGNKIAGDDETETQTDGEYDETATATTADDGTTLITLNGTLFGTLV
jgi:hypothetical protein